MNIAQKVRLHKEKRPDLYCSDKRCLWRVVRVSGEVTPCRKHNLLPRPDVGSDSGVRARLESPSNNGQPAVNELTAGNRADRNYSGSDTSKITASEVTK